MTGEPLDLTLMGWTDAKTDMQVWRLNTEYHHTLLNGSVVTVPAGFYTNFGTIPKIFHSILKPIELREAALVHDYLCGESIYCKSKLGVLGLAQQAHATGCSRWLADAVIYDIMRQMGYSWTWRISVWSCVRLCGLSQGKV